MSANAVHPLWILGAGGHGRVVADAAREKDLWSQFVFFDDGSPPGTIADEGVIGGGTSDFLAASPMPVQRIVAIGNNRQRFQILTLCDELDLELVSVVHPRAIVSRGAALAPGCFVAAGAVISTGAILGRGTIVNTGASVDHDCWLGEAVHVSPGARLGGGVRVGDRAWIGLGAAVRHGAHIGADSVVGVGAVVLAGVADNLVMVGNPARVLEDTSDA